MEVRKKLNPLKAELVKEGKLIHASDRWWSNDKDFHYSTNEIAESKIKYDEAMKELNKRVKEKFPNIFKEMAEACYKTKDTVHVYTALMPIFKSSIRMEVEPVANIDEYPDPKLQYNLVYDFTAFSPVDFEKNKYEIDYEKANIGLLEIGRVYNLHVVAGVPMANINMVLAIHGPAIFSFLNNEAYQREYKTDNPNLEIINELSNAGVRFLVCGQAMHWMKINKEDLVPKANVTLTAQTTITSYSLKGYALLKMSNDY